MIREGAMLRRVTVDQYQQQHQQQQQQQQQQQHRQKYHNPAKPQQQGQEGAKTAPVLQGQQQPLTAYAAAGTPALFLLASLLQLARMHISPGHEWLSSASSLLVALLEAGQAPPDAVSRALLGLARLGYKPTAAAEADALLSGAVEALPALSRAGLVRTLHAVSRLSLTPSPDWLDVFYDAVDAAPGRFTPPGFGMVVWALARLRAAPDPAWLLRQFDATFAAGSGGGDNSDDSDNSGNAAAISNAAAAPPLRPQHLANLLCALASLRVAPGPERMSLLAGQLDTSGGPLAEMDHFHIEWAWRELHDAYAAAAATGAAGAGAGAAAAAAAFDELY
jgi:hypothetical protein